MKKCLVLVATLACGVTLLAAPADAATLDGALSSSSILLGQPVSISGTVTPAEATPRVVIQRRINGRWYDRLTAQVDPETGAYTASITPSGAGAYELRVRTAGGTVTTAPMTLLVWPPTVSASLSTATTTAGSTVYVTGTLRPAAAASQVTLQRSTAGGWSDRATASVDPATGAFRISVTPSQVGTYLLRVRAKGASVNSAVLTLVVGRPTPVTPTAPPSPPSTTPTTTPATTPSGNCNPNYTPCVPNASDVDCAGGSGNGPAYVEGPVRVIGVDVYGLDGNDHDGIGCE